MQTEQLATYIQSIHYPSLDPPTIQAAKMCVQDFLGVAIAGSVKKESEIWRAYYSGPGCVSNPQAATFEPAFPAVSCEQAAALNAVYGHVMDMDDVHNASITHLAAITVPTAFALGQLLKKSGRDVIESITAGYEAGARIGEAINPSSYRYWHTTGAVGPFASGAAAGKLLGLSKEEMQNCFGSAGTQSSGLWEFLTTGAMSKVLHTANANLCGIRSAGLAKLGFTGAPQILEGERGFLRALAPEFDLDAITKEYGQGYRITTNSFKPYACCRHIHSANYGMEKIMNERCPDPKQIVSITDHTYGTAYQTANNPYPENPYAAKFSIQFCLAAAILLKDLSDRAFTQENLARQDIRDLMRNIRVEVDEELDQAYQKDPNRWSHRIVMEQADGSIIEEQVDYPIGDFQNPFDQDMADHKFMTLTADLIGEQQAGALIDRLHHLEELSDINRLFSH